jgi:hypothetical protein
MADTLKQFGRKLDQLGRAVSGGALRQITTRVAGEAKKIASPAVDPHSLSHWGKRKGSYAVRARYQVKSDTEASLRPTVPPLAALLTFGGRGPWKKPRPRGGGRRKRGTGGGTYERAPVPARHAWISAANRAGDAVPRLVHQEVLRVLSRTFGGG